MTISNKDIVNNTGWQFFQRFSGQIVNFLVGMVLARLLVPEDYGTVAIVQVVVVFFDAFSSRGFNQALLQKHDADSLDYSTVCWFNVGLNALFFLGLFISAPWIAAFYNDPQLTLMIRILSSQLIITGYDKIQQVYIQKQMQFKKLFLPSILGTTISATVGLILAFSGAGAWALVVQTMVGTSVGFLTLFFTISWRPRLEFSLARLKAMSGYGVSMLLTSLAESVYNELRSLVIGKLYSTADLAFHDKGRQIPTLVMSNVQNSVSTVFFSALTHENSRQAMRDKVRDNLNMLFFLMAPILMGLASVSTPMLTVLYTEKWVGASPYLVMYCLTYMTWVIQTPALQAINAIGRADVTLKITLGQCVLGIALLLAMMSYGAVAVALSVLIGSVAATVVIMIVFGVMFKYSFRHFIEDIGVTTVQTCLMVLAVFFAGMITNNLIVKLLVQVTVGVIVYVGLSEMFKNKAYFAIKNTLFAKFKK